MVSARVLVSSLVCAALLLGACVQAPRDSLRFGLASMPVTLDPRFATDAASARINRLLYRQLVDFDEHAMPVPSLAVWQRVGARHYRFRLSGEGTRFSDGARLTAADVRATYEYVLDEANGSPHRLSLGNIAAIEDIDDDTIEFRLKRADPLFPGRLTLGILPRRLIEAAHPFNRAPVGSGPFEFVDWPDEARLRLRRRGDGQLLEFVAVQDPTVRVLKLLRGEIDMLQSDLTPELVTWLKQRPEVRVERGRGSNFAYLGFNLRDGVTADPRVRRAAAHALDRDAIIRHVFGDGARPAAAILPPEHWAGSGDLRAIPHDKAAARRLLDEAGYRNGHAPRIVYTTSTDPFRLRLATIIQRQLAEAGFEIELRSYDWGTFYGDIRSGRFQMYSLMWVGIKLPEIFRYAFHSESLPPAGANRGFFVSPAADRLIEQAEAAPTLEAQRVPLARLQALLLEELPYVPLWYEDHVTVTRTGIEGYRIAADGNYDSLSEVVRRRADGG
jgi:peptide/nickel transport system substrate-binding protein